MMNRLKKLMMFRLLLLALLSKKMFLAQELMKLKKDFIINMLSMSLLKNLIS